MKKPLNFLRLVTTLCLFFSPTLTHAAGQDIKEIFYNLVLAFSPLWVVAGLLVLVVTGFTLMTANDEGKLDKAKNTIIAIVIGGIVTTIILVLGMTNFIGILYDEATHTDLTPFMTSGTGRISLEAAGIADWLTTISVMLGIVFIIIAALRAVASLGDEGKYSNARNALIQAVIGFIVIGAAYVFRAVFFDIHEPSLLIALFAGRILIVLTIITTIAVAILIYAGFRMIISFGDESQYEAAKSLAIRALVGLFIILISYALVYIVVNIFS